MTDDHGIDIEYGAELLHQFDDSEDEFSQIMEDENKEIKDSKEDLQTFAAPAAIKEEQDESSSFPDYKKMDEKEMSSYVLNLADAPIFYPTEEEFEDTYSYMEKIFDEGSKYGICKVVPPKSWKPPFAIDPDNLSFSPRVQPLCLLEAKRRTFLMFHTKLSFYWAMFGLQVNYPVKLRGREVDLHDLNDFVTEKANEVDGDVNEIGDDEWSWIASKLGLVEKEDREGLISRLRAVYEMVVSPMEEFSKLVMSEVKKFYIKTECKAANNRKRRMMAGGGSSRRSVKKMMKTSANSAYTGSVDFNFDTFNTGRMNEGMCRNCSATEKLDRMRVSICSSCGIKCHDVCMELQLPHSEGGLSMNELLIPSYESYICKGCTAYKLYHDPIIKFGFKDCPTRFSLGDFEDYADSFKQMYFGVNSPLVVPEREVEGEFWKLVLDSPKDVSVLYGADLQTQDGSVGSGFPTLKKKYNCDTDPDFKHYAENGWNLSNLPTLNDSILRHIGSNVSGMTQAWMYVGMVFSAFCWHTEDHWTPSINYLHFGETKTWYGVPGTYAEAFDRRIQKYVPALFSAQPDLMHNLNTMIHPRTLVSGGIPVCRTDQHAGEFVITFPRAYHGGFNQGFNCAEAVNFATSRWLPFGFDSIRHYATIKRNNVFSHEELLCKLALDSSCLNLENKKQVHTQLMQLISEEKELWDELSPVGIKRKRARLESIEDDDERTCYACSQTLFFSMISCSCRGNLAPKMRQSCRKHFKELCRCAWTKRQHIYRYTIHELESITDKLKTAIEIETENLKMK